MHGLDGTYSDSPGNYSCSLWIEGGEPYIVLNLEKYWDLNNCSGEHCDFVYICEKDGVWYVYVVELKDIKKPPEDKKEIEKLRESIRNKFGNSLKFVEKELLDFLIKSFRQRRVRVEYHCVLAVDWSVYNKVSALFNRSLIIPTYKPKSGIVNPPRIKGCGDTLW